MYRKLLGCVVFASAIALLGGCAGQQVDNSGVVTFVSTHEEKALVGNDVVSYGGSGVQLDSNYVVTAEHVMVDPRQGTSAYSCDVGCDMKFVRRDGVATVQWRDVVKGEQLTFRGITLVRSDRSMDIRKRNLVYTGHDAAIQMQTYNSGDTYVRLARVDTQEGMSGGPVFGADGKAVGILSGSTVLKRVGHDVYNRKGDKVAVTPDVASAESEGKYEMYSGFVPYSVIREQWAHFQAKTGKHSEAVAAK